MAELTPMMQQYMETKKQYEDCILFYRLGDFYEMFFEDAITASRELEITLTGRDCGQEERAPMCGVPFHSAEGYIAKLISKGYKVAICEQLEDPKLAKGIVKRDVIRVITPGTVVEGNLLDENKNNYIMSIFKKGIYFGVAVCDVTTGDFYATQITETNNFEKLLDEIARYTPAEIVVNDLLFSTKEEINKISERFNLYVTKISDEEFKEDYKNSQYKFVENDDKEVENINGKLFAVAASNGLLFYLKDTQKIELQHINKIIVYSIVKYMSLDMIARRNLELTEKLRDKGKKGTLLWVLDKTSTSMGRKTFKKMD